MMDKRIKPTRSLAGVLSRLDFAFERSFAAAIASGQISRDADLRALALLEEFPTTLHHRHRPLDAQLRGGALLARCGVARRL